MSGDTGPGPFGRRTAILGIAASLIAGLLFFLFASYAPNAANNVGVTATPASNSAVGYSGFVRLLEQAGPPTRQLTRMRQIGARGLLLVFVDPVDSPDSLKDIIRRRRDQPTLFVLPKWDVRPIGLNRNRVQAAGTLPPEQMQALLDAVTPAAENGGLESVGGYPAKLLLAAADRPLWVLTDPDVINNAGIDDIANARAMFAMIDELRYTGDPVLIATPRLASGGGRNLGKLLFDPPFLPLAIILLFAGLLALLHGFVRFGPVTQRARMFAFGKRALVDTTADLLRRAGRISGLGPRYADTMRRRAAERLGAPAALRGGRLDEWLDRRGRKGEPSFTQAIANVHAATGEEELHRSARALATWIERAR